MNWSVRQQGMLSAMGLGFWPASQEAAAILDLAPSTASDASPVASPVASSAIKTPVPLPGDGVVATWADLPSLHEAVRTCTACGLCRGRRQAVPGVGHPQARWMVVGEAPGEQEDLLGEPFVGPSGRLLDAMLAAVGRTRQSADGERQVFIANTLKCRPPGNRNPSPDELKACAPYLEGQLALIRPRVVLALGRFAAQSVLGREEPIGRLRGTVHALHDGTPVVVSYHPSYLLRQPLEKAKAWADLCLAAEVDDRAKAL